jgi:hypothetical protein
MDEDGEGPKIKHRKITYLLLNLTPLPPPTLPSLRPHSHASCLPQLVLALPLVLCRLPSGGVSICPPLVAPPPLIVPLFFSGVLASCLPQLFVMSPLVMPLPPVHLRLFLSSHCRLSLRPSCISSPAGCRVASHYADTSCWLAPLTLIALLPLVAPLSCLLSTLAGCHVASNVVQNGLRSCEHCKEMQGKMEHPFIRVLGGSN